MGEIGIKNILLLLASTTVIKSGNSNKNNNNYQSDASLVSDTSQVAEAVSQGHMVGNGESDEHSLAV